MAKEIFLSHATADKDLVDAFENLLTQTLGLTSADIFCTSLEGQGVKKGGSFVDEIRSEAQNAKAVVALVSPAYLDSAFCMAELGAAWALNKHRLPIVVPPNTFKVMDATLLGIVGVKIDDEDALAQALEELCKEIGRQLPALTVRTRAVRTFLRNWQALKAKVPGPARIEASIHDSVVQERDAAIQARDEAEIQLSKAEEKIKAISRLKDANKVKSVLAEFKQEDWEYSLNRLLEDIRNLYSELGGQHIVKCLIANILGKTIHPDFQSYPDQSERAYELDVYEPDSKQWNWGNSDVKLLKKYVGQVQSLIAESEEAVEEFKSRGQQADPYKVRFWEQQL